MMTRERNEKLTAIKEQGEEMFKELAPIVLKAEPTSVGATALLYAMTKLTACVLKSHMMTGMPICERYTNMVSDWMDLLEDDAHYDDQQPFDEYILTLMEKRTYN